MTYITDDNDNLVKDEYTQAFSGELTGLIKWARDNKISPEAFSEDLIKTVIALAEMMIIKQGDETKTTVAWFVEKPDGKSASLTVDLSPATSSHN